MVVEKVTGYLKKSVNKTENITVGSNLKYKDRPPLIEKGKTKPLIERRFISDASSF